MCLHLLCLLSIIVSHSPAPLQQELHHALEDFFKFLGSDVSSSSKVTGRVYRLPCMVSGPMGRKFRDRTNSSCGQLSDEDSSEVFVWAVGCLSGGQGTA